MAQGSASQEKSGTSRFIYFFFGELFSFFWLNLIHFCNNNKKKKISIICDNSDPQTLRYQADIPFVNTKFGVLFGVDCINDKARNFNGDISQVI